jgi:hypothetical protein
MIKKELIQLHEEAYVSPTATVMEICTEGVLCASGEFEEWEDDVLPW